MEINEIENRKIIEKTNENKSRFFEKFKKINKTLAALIKEKKKQTKLTNIGIKEERIQILRHEKGEKETLKTTLC